MSEDLLAIELRDELASRYCAGLRRADVDNVSAVLARLGTVRNPVLFSSTSFSGLMMSLSSNVEQGHHFHIFLLAVAVFVMGLAFYVFGFLRLPSSTQELLFLQEATIAVERHHAKAVQTRRRTKADA